LPHATNSSALDPLKDRIEQKYDQLLDLVDNRTLELLNDAAAIYGEEFPEINATVDNVTVMYQQFMDRADEKFKEADKLAETDLAR
jgi:short-subunit dehydrogenase involved in D-alanine esterification of teichoic acids